MSPQLRAPHGELRISRSNQWINLIRPQRTPTNQPTIQHHVAFY